MAKLGINTGSNPNDGQGDPLRVAMGKINSNFTEIYSVIGDGNNLISYASTAGISTLAKNLTGSPRINVSGVLNTGITTTEHLEVRNITSTGIITAVQFVGDGSQLENVVATSAGVEVLDDSVRRGVAQELNFGENIVCSGPDGAGRVTISVGNNVIVGYAATYAQISGVSTYAVTSGVSTYSGLSGVSTYAGVAGVATYATNAGVSSLATFAANAGGATYAALAGVSTYAGVAGVATYSEVSGVSTYSVLTGVSTYSGVAGVATYATNAGVSSYAVLAGVSSYAVVSGVATYATNAGVSSYAVLAGVSSYAINSGVSTYAGVAGVSTALQNSRTFQITGDVVASSVSFDGTGNVSLAATIQPNSVGLGTDTTGDYVRDLTGTANQITVTSGTGEGSSPIVSIANNPTIPGNVTIGNDLQVNNNLNVTGNITIGGTSAYVISDEFRVKDADIVLGFTTNISGQDASTDNTANHGGIAVASTEGTPLVSLFIAGIETNPPTYKKIMWFKSGSFAGLNTDAWLSNYAVGIGSTQFPVGTRLAAGSVQFNDRDLTVVRGVNASGIVTGSSFRPSSGYIQAADGTNSFFIYNSTGNVAFQGTIGASQINNASGFKVIGFAGTDITFENNARISGVTTSVGGFVGNLTGTATTATNSGYASLAGVATYAGVSGVATYAGVSGVATYAGTSGVSTTSGYATTAGISTLSQGLTGTPNISVNQVGISSNLSVSGITTFYNDVHIESNRSLLIGSGNELQLFNSGLDSYIENTSAGNLIIRDGGTGIQLRKSGGGPGAGLMAVFNTDAGVELYYNSVIKLQTFQNGVAINESVGIGSTASNPPYRLTVSGVGATITQGLANAIADLTSSVNGYGQVNIRNSLSGTNASGDLVITADSGTDTSNYVNLGINNTGFTTSSWTISGPLDGYLYTSDGNLAIGAGASAKYISLFAGGTLAVNEVVRVSDLGVGIYTTVPQAALHVSGDGIFTGIVTAGSVISGIASVSQLNVSGVGTFQSSGLQIRNPANTFGYTITGGAIAADRTLNLPVITGTATLAVLNISQTFTNTQTFNGTLSAAALLSLSGNTSGTHVFGTNQTTGTLTFGGTSGTGTITFGRSTASQQTDIQAGASGVGTTKTINFGTGGLSGSFTQINIGPTAGLGTVAINSGTNLLVGTTTSTGTASQLLQVTGGGYVSGKFGVGTTLPTSNVSIAGSFAAGIFADTFAVSNDGDGIVRAGSNIIGGSVGTSRVNIQDRAGSLLSFYYSTGLIGRINVANTTDLSVEVGGSERIRIHNSTGNVGIGTTIATEALSVLPKIQILNNSSADGRLIFRAKPGNAYRWNIDNDGDTNNFRFFREDDANAANGTAPFQITPTGNAILSGNLNAAGNYYVKLARTSNQTITSLSDTLIGFSAISDGNNWFNSGNNRITPTVAGNYCINAMVKWEAGAATNTVQSNIQIRRNGTTAALSVCGVQTHTYTMNVSAIVTLNGSTDYVELTAYTGNPTSQDIGGDAGGTLTKLEMFKLN